MASAPRRIRWVVVVGAAVLCTSAPAVGQTANQPPQCPADPTLTVATGQPLVLPGSPCSDPEGQPVTPILVEGPRYGVLSGPAANGSRTYTSNPGYIGTDLIRFKASDGTSESPVSTLTIHVVGQGGGGGDAPRAGRVQQQIEGGAMLTGQRLPMWVLVSDLAAGQEVSVRIEPSEPLREVDPACAPNGTAYLCAVRAGPAGSTTQLQLKYVAGAPGRFTLTSRIVHSGVSDTDSIDVLPPPIAGRTVALVDGSSCTRGRPVRARIPRASAFTSICPGRTLPVGTRFKTPPPRSPHIYWSRGGRVRTAVLEGNATVTQPGARALKLRLAKPRGCRGFERVEVGPVGNTGAIHIETRFARVTIKQRSVVAVREYCNRALIGVRGAVVIRDLVHRRTVRLSAEHQIYVVRR